MSKLATEFNRVFGNNLVSAIEQTSEALKEARRLKKLERDLRAYIDDNCSCGGSGPDDPERCEMCKLYHALGLGDDE